MTDNFLDAETWRAACWRRARSFSASMPADMAGHLAYKAPLLQLSPHNASSTIVNGRVVLDKPRFKVALVGGGTGREEAPVDDPEWEVWCPNLVYALDSEKRLRCDRWFDIHQRHAQTADDLLWMRHCPFPLYVPDDLVNVSPLAVRYPIEEVEADLGVNYWTCTFAYWLGLILHERQATDIGLYGIELLLGTLRERTVEAACVAYWLGRATERGLRIHTPHRTTLARHPARYGLEYTEELEAVLQYTDDVATIAQSYAMRRSRGARDGLALEHDLNGSPETVN